MAALNIKNKTVANNTVNTTIVVNQPIVTPLFFGSYKLTPFRGG